MTHPDDLDIEKALIFFHAYMYGPLRGKMRLFSARGLAPRAAMSEDWELFASILVRDRGVATQSGLDLEGYEVKSAKDRGSFEYQYHKNSWREKLATDRKAGHIFISHSDGLRLVEVRYCEGSKMNHFFDAWEAERPYEDPSQQRFRNRCRTAGCARTPTRSCASSTAKCRKTKAPSRPKAIAGRVSSPYDPRYAHFRRRLRQARLSAGLTQVQAGAALGKPQQFINRCEAGDRRVDVLELVDFAHLYRVSLEWLAEMPPPALADGPSGR